MYDGFSLCESFEYDDTLHGSEIPQQNLNRRIPYPYAHVNSRHAHKHCD